jgi:hypothetical protein
MIQLLSLPLNITVINSLELIVMLEVPTMEQLYCPLIARKELLYNVEFIIHTKDKFNECNNFFGL